jgi:hypothetical protein
MTRDANEPVIGHIKKAKKQAELISKFFFSYRMSSP